MACSYCHTEGHNIKTCNSKQEHREFYNQNQIKFNKELNQFFADKGIGKGTILSVKYSVDTTSDLLILTGLSKEDYNQLSCIRYDFDDLFKAKFLQTLENCYSVDLSNFILSKSTIITEIREKKDFLSKRLLGKGNFSYGPDVVIIERAPKPFVVDENRVVLPEFLN